MTWPGGSGPGTWPRGYDGGGKGGCGGRGDCASLGGGLGGWGEVHVWGEVHALPAPTSADASARGASEAVEDMLSFKEIDLEGA